MSDLQAALLAIGLGVIVIVYGAGWWQQRQYHRKFGEAFKVNAGDALYDAHQAPVEHVFNALAEDLAVTETFTSSSVLDESCGLVNNRSDFIIELTLSEPSPAATLQVFWSRRFDFGKPVQVCGLGINSAVWERVIADSATLYVKLRLSLQLADRSGAVNLTKLADFRDLVLGIAHDIQAEISVPDVADAHQRAVELDAWCAAVDQMVGINLLASTGRSLRASNIVEAASLQGMQLESDGALHAFNVTGQSLFHLINQDSSPFQHHTLAQATSSGLTLLLDVPRVANPVQQFAAMCAVAKNLAHDLQLNLVDDQRVVLSASGLERIRAQIAAVEAKMLAQHIEPGSAQARRLFS
ncbi:MAG: cell division protein ZipA C-terminal FtsZ-binding domain-containing protein [Sideroxydans sp.]|nr:cell division protein ZipA C-terminal FtsZ-binding domain-containing protein [Sideroxydans sp.]